MHAVRKTACLHSGAGSHDAKEHRHLGQIARHLQQRWSQSLATLPIAIWHTSCSVLRHWIWRQPRPSLRFTRRILGLGIIDARTGAMEAQGMAMHDCLLCLVGAATHVVARLSGKGPQK